MSWRETLRRRDFEAMSQQKHRPCKKHGDVKEVCEQCVKVICRKCGHACPKPKMVIPGAKVKLKRRATDDSPYAPPPELQAIWPVFHSLGALYLDAHQDSGQWMAVFPAQHMGLVTAGEMADKLWGNPKLKEMAKSTAYRAGRIKQGWWISFELK